MIVITEVLDSASLKALSIDTRQEIMKMLAKRPYTPSELSRALNKHVTTISEHLSTLEKSGLARRKESEHKWVYYVLTDKGEKLFKPRYYSWTIVLSLALIAFVAGVWQMFSRSFYSYGAAVQSVQSPALTETAKNVPAAAATAPISIEVLAGIFLISASMIGFGFLVGKFLRK